jgi:hypothetical protein
MIRVRYPNAPLMKREITPFTERRDDMGEKR